MLFNLEICTDSADFNADHDAMLAHLLRKVAERIEAGRFERENPGIIRDDSGDNVGSWELREY